MGKLKQISLSDEPNKALIELANFIDTMNLPGHQYPDGADKREFTGYWQPIEYFYELQGYASEARRVANHSST